MACKKVSLPRIREVGSICTFVSATVTLGRLRLVNQMAPGARSVASLARVKVAGCPYSWGLGSDQDGRRMQKNVWEVSSGLPDSGLMVDLDLLAMTVQHAPLGGI